MSELKIEKGIPIPTGGTKTSKVGLTFQKMDVGDSVFMPGRENGAGLSQYAKSLGMKIKTRKVEGGIRVWRTE